MAILYEEKIVSNGSHWVRKISRSYYLNKALKKKKKRIRTVRIYLFITVCVPEGSLNIHIIQPDKVMLIDWVKKLEQFREGKMYGGGNDVGTENKYLIVSDASKIGEMTI
jgi:hypothetical protein